MQIKAFFLSTKNITVTIGLLLVVIGILSSILWNIIFVSILIAGVFYILAALLAIPRKDK